MNIHGSSCNGYEKRFMQLELVLVLKVLRYSIPVTPIGYTIN